MAYAAVANDRYLPVLLAADHVRLSLEAVLGRHCSSTGCAITEIDLGRSRVLLHSPGKPRKII
jgi:hypothetical protein